MLKCYIITHSQLPFTHFPATQESFSLHLVCNLIFHLKFTDMKVRLLFLFVCLAWNGWAESFTPYSRDSLKKGDWFTFECVHYYPYVAPGIQEEIP